MALPERWILARLNQTVADVTRLIEAYEFGQAGTLTNEFLWGDFADWYIESAKVTLAGGESSAKANTRAVLAHVLDQALRLLHPFVPFVTEALWGHLPHPSGEAPALIVAAWPQAGTVDQAAIEHFSHLQELVRGIRNARAENKVEQARRIPATIVAGGQADWLSAQRPVLLALARLDEAHTQIVATVPEKPRQAIALVLGGTEMYLPLEGLVDLAGECERLKREAADYQRQIAKSEALLASDFTGKAPVAVVERERAKLAGLCATQEKLAARLAEMC
jgi:valyl-tRNA synthetase